MIEEDADKVVGKRIQALRERKGLLQGELSGQIRAAGVNWSQGTLSKVEMGTRPVRLSEAPVVASTLGVGLMELVPEWNFLEAELSKFRWSERGAREAAEDSAYRLGEVRRFRQRVQLLSELAQGRPGPYVVPMSAGAFLDECRDDPVTGGWWHTAREILEAVGMEVSEIDAARDRATEALDAWKAAGADKDQFAALLSLDMREQAAPNWVGGSARPDEDWAKSIEVGALNDLIHEECGRVLAERFPQVDFRPSIDGRAKGFIEGLDESMMDL